MKKYAVYIARKGKVRSFPLMTLSQVLACFRSEVRRKDKAVGISIGPIDEPTRFITVTFTKE